jgi:hypothetical protein
MTGKAKREKNAPPLPFRLAEAFARARSASKAERSVESNEEGPDIWRLSKCSDLASS